jgi:hypothetical protein
MLYDISCLSEDFRDLSRDSRYFSGDSRGLSGDSGGSQRVSGASQVSSGAHKGYRSLWGGGVLGLRGVLRGLQAVLGLWGRLG